MRNAVFYKAKVEPRAVRFLPHDPYPMPKGPTPYALPRTLWRRVLIMSLATFVCVGILGSDLFAQTKKFQWSGRVGFSEQYTSNLFLAPDNEEDDWITRIGPGLTLAVLFQNTEVRLNYDLRYAIYANNSDLNTPEHYLTLSGLKDVPISERMTLDLDLSVTRAGDPAPLAEQVTSTRRTREPYWRYITGGRVNYNFGEEDLVYVGFDYTQLENDDPTVQDSRGYGPKAGVVYWFNIRNGLSADLTYRQAEFDFSSDYDAYRGSGTYTYRFNPRTQANLTYGYDRVDYDEETVEGRIGITDGTLVVDRDFQVHSFTLGASHEFTPNVSGSVSAGFSLRKPKTGEDTTEPTGSFSLNTASERSSFNLAGTFGPGFQTLQASNLGYNVFFRVSAVYTYQLIENLSTSLGASYWYYDYKDTASVQDIATGLEIDNRKDQTWSGSASLSYSFLTWLSGSLTYQYRQRESNVDLNDFIDNRVTLSLTAFYLSEPKQF